MKKYQLLLGLALMGLSVTGFGQNVGIGTSTPSQKLHVSDATLPNSATIRVSGLSTTTTLAAGTGPFSVVIVDANGVMYRGGTAGAGNNNAWMILGNAGTTAATNFIGTTDAQSFVVKTNGSAATNERIRFQTNGQITANGTVAFAGDLFGVYGSGYAGSINSTAGVFDFPINGYSTSTFAGIYGENTGTGQGVLGINASTGAGVWGQNGSTGFGVVGFNTAGGAGVIGQSTTGIGVAGVANGNTVTGVRGFNQNVGGTGILGLGNNITPGTTIVGGSGVAANGTAFGMYSFATNATGTGILSGGSNTGSLFSINGEGVAGNGVDWGTTGFATGVLANNRWGGYFDFNASVNGFAYVGGRTGGTDYAILSAGTKSTMVPDALGQNRIMFCTEAPEVLFQDFGTGQLVGGTAHITLDPVLVQNIQVDATHPLKVFIQLEGNCNGVYVANKTASGFDVIELAGGTSNTTFTWQIVANRADAISGGVVTSEYSDLRFPIGPQRPVTITNTEKVNVAPIGGNLNMPVKTGLPSGAN